MAAIAEGFVCVFLEVLPIWLGFAEILRWASAMEMSCMKPLVFNYKRLKSFFILHSFYQNDPVDVCLCGVMLWNVGPIFN